MIKNLTTHFTAVILCLQSIGADSPWEMIRSGNAPNPREMSGDMRSVFIKAAKDGRAKNDNKNECIQFLIDAGDSETIAEVFAIATNYNLYPRSRWAWKFFERSTNPNLLVLLIEPMSEPESPGLAFYANEFHDVPSSTRAAMATLSIVAQSKVFPREAAQWAIQTRGLERQDQFNTLRESARAFTKLNLAALQEGRYADAILPPDLVNAPPPTAAPDSGEERPASAGQQSDLGAKPGSSTPHEKSSETESYFWVWIAALAVAAASVAGVKLGNRRRVAGDDE